MRPCPRRWSGGAGRSWVWGVVEVGGVVGGEGYLPEEDRFGVRGEGLERVVRGLPPLSPGIARRLLTHFRHGSGGEGQTSGSGFSTSSGLTTSKPVPLETPPDHERLTPRESEGVFDRSEKGLPASLTVLTSDARCIEARAKQVEQVLVLRRRVVDRAEARDNLAAERLSLIHISEPTRPY